MQATTIHYVQENNEVQWKRGTECTKGSTLLTSNTCLQILEDDVKAKQMAADIKKQNRRKKEEKQLELMIKRKVREGKLRVSQKSAESPSC